MATGGIDADKLSDETFDLLCTVCKQEGKNVEADKFCTDCSDYYCSKCVKVHDTVPVLKGHKIVDKGHTLKGSGKPLPMVPTERCHTHGQKPVDMYCQNHDEVGCSTCLTVGHRLCEDIFYIPEFIQKTNFTAGTRDLRKEFESTERVLTENFRKCEREKRDTLRKMKESIGNIREFRREINRLLDDLEKKSVTEIEGKYKVTLDEWEEEIKILQEMKAKVDSAKTKLTSVGSNISQAFVDIKAGQAIIQKAKQLNDGTSGKKIEEIMFSADERLVELLKEMKSLGKVTTTCLEKNSLLQVKERKSFSVKMKSDIDKCCIISSCILKDGTVIMADNNNKKLKRLDKSTYTVRDHLDLPDKPWQVCVTDTQEVAASYQEREIMFVSLGNEMKKKSLMKTDFKFFCVAYANNNLYISDYTKTVYIFSISGEKLKKISLDMLASSSIRSIAVTTDGSKIHVATSKNGLITLDNNGYEVGKYDGTKLQYATSVHVATVGTVLVSGYDSNNVLQFGPHGELMGEVIKFDGNGRGCKSVCCNNDMTRLIVGRAQNDIEVYNIM